MVVQCPICDASFPESEVEKHAEECMETRFDNNSEPTGITFGQIKDVISVPVDGKRKHSSSEDNSTIEEFVLTRHSSCTETASSPSSGKKSRKEQAEACSFLGSYRQNTSPAQHTENAHSSFSQQSVQKSGDSSGVPLAEKMRPATLDNYIGQESILSSNSFLKNLIMQNNFINMILWGPPGCGKTSLANIIHERCRGSDKWRYTSLSACTSEVQDVKNVVREAQGALQMKKKRTLLFMDEVHRFNKAQQDIFLPHIESGVLTLVGATTENPSFTLNSTLISRCRVITLDALSPSSIRVIVKRALKRLKINIDKKTKVKVENGEKVNEGGVGSEDKEEEEQEDEETEDEETDDAPQSNVRISMESIHWLSEMSRGDARCALSTLQILVESHNSELITISDAKETLQRSHVLYDRKGDEHYNFASALQKSIRDENAALYWTTRMIKGGEDPQFIARRLVSTAAEDVVMTSSALPLSEEHRGAKQLFHNSTPTTSRASSVSTNPENGPITGFEGRVLMRLQSLEESMDEILQMLRTLTRASRVTEEELLEDVIPSPLSTTDELNRLCERLTDKTFKRQLACSLTSLGGHNIGDTVRRMLYKIGTNALWSSYSFKGRKGKSSLIELPVTKILVRSCLKSHPKAKASEVEDQISETLKYAPKKKGGAKYKEPAVKEICCKLDEESDVDTD